MDTRLFKIIFTIVAVLALWWGSWLFFPQDSMGLIFIVYLAWVPALISYCAKISNKWKTDKNEAAEITVKFLALNITLMGIGFLCRDLQSMNIKLHIGFFALLGVLSLYWFGAKIIEFFFACARKRKDAKKKENDSV